MKNNASRLPPPHLNATAAEKWPAILPLLEARGDLDQATMDGTAAYCVAWAAWTEAQAKVSELGTVVKTASGLPAVSPYLVIAEKAAAANAAMGPEMRLTPKSKSKAPARAAPQRPGRRRRPTPSKNCGCEINTQQLIAALGIDPAKLEEWLAAGLPHRRVGRRPPIRPRRGSKLAYRQWPRQPAAIRQNAGRGRGRRRHTSPHIDAVDQTRRTRTNGTGL